MKKEFKEAIENYQCPGCVCGSNISCYKKGNNIECGKHVAGTYIGYIGKVFLGMPTGFNRIGNVEKMSMQIFKSLNNGYGYDKYNIPVWKYLNENNHVIVRGISPRTNAPFIHIFLENCINKIDCLEITQEDINFMD